MINRKFVKKDVKKDVKKVVKKAMVVVLSGFVLCGLVGCSDSKKVTTTLNSQGSQKNSTESSNTEAIPEIDDSTMTDTEETVVSEIESSTEELKLDYENEIDITEKLYVSWINEIYTNFDNYKGKTVKIEGMYTAQQYADNGPTYYFVYRVGPGCCGNDGSMCGFEFTYGDKMPKDNDWICVEGILDSYEENGVTYLTIKAKNVTVMDQRGAENVNN